MNVFAVGRIGHDAEVRMAGQTSIAVFSLAVDVGYGDRKQTDWYRCQLWGKRAEGGLVQYLVKGQEVAVTGKLKQNKYTNKSGVEKVSMDIDLNDIDLVGGQRQQDNGFSQQQQPSGTGGQQFNNQEQSQQPDFEQDIPF